MFLLYHDFIVMLRICIVIISLMLYGGTLFASVGVELDVSFRDSTVRCQNMYVLSPSLERMYDTLAIFDTLSFNGQNRVSLFYSANPDTQHRIAIVDTSGIEISSRYFTVSPQRTTFAVYIGQQSIRVINSDFIYPQKNDDERSYFVFLFIFFVIKILITSIFIFSSKLPKRLISAASGTFLLTAFIDWLFPLHYLSRFFITLLTEYLLIAYIGRVSISWWKAAILVLFVNIIGFGLITTLYLLFVFW